MIKVGGNNKFSQIGESKNNKIVEDGSCIPYPIKLDINISELLSFSTYSNHTVWITQDFIGHALGDNREAKISGTITLEIQDHEKEFYLADSQGLPISILSAVCGNFYTLYLVTRQDGKHLGFVHRAQNEGIPLFVNLNGRQPIAIFGGWETAAAILENGEIVVITETVFDSPLKPVETHRLPKGEKAISVACCSKSIIALTKSGRVFIATLTWDNVLSHFKEIPELRSQNVVDISGTYKHFLVVTDDGKVFGQGDNLYGKLGFDKENEKIEKFTEIESLRAYKIVHAYAGDDHSLFQTESGKIIACGKNNFGQLLLENGPSDECVYSPVETSIEKGATFCIAGNCSSVVFIDACPPSNTPNIRIP